ncbi:MAG: purine-nucleoside phosphorylase [Thermoleophilaceae bacterium]|jgi:uridine phosphorylase|nr:purine-nucleoside phosphorylase [Thermoleophilaceae bacterium]
MVPPIPSRPIHLNPAAELAERVLLPGDPQRALTMAQALLDGPKMFNARRGLWGYTGTAPDGGLVTIQSTGMGGPSAAIVVEELIDLGARVLVRTGTCAALDGALALGDLMVAASVLPADGASAALGAERLVKGDARLTDALAAAAGGGAARMVVTTDLFYDPRPGQEDAWRDAGAAAIEMEAATVLTVAARRGARAACLLLVSDVLAGDGRARLSDEELEAGGERLGRVALRALAELQQ